MFPGRNNKRLRNGDKGARGYQAERTPPRGPHPAAPRVAMLLGAPGGRWVAAGREKCQGIPQRAVPQGAVLGMRREGLEPRLLGHSGAAGDPPTLL